MKAKASIITKYDEADSSGKVDLICRYYPNFLGIVDGYTEGLCYVIENEKSYNRKASRGDLGVRVQSSGHYSDVTADAAIENVVTIKAIISCDFSDGILDGVDRAREFLKEALILRDMRRHYDLFNKQLGILSNEENQFFRGYLSGEQNLNDLADQAGIQYESAGQKVRRIKKKIKIQMVGFLEGQI